MEATHEERAHKQMRVNAPPMLNRLESPGLQTPTDPINFGLVQHPLSNFTVLRNIFTFLDDEDLESCCNVSRYWRTVADPFVLSHYDMKLDRIYVHQENQDALAKDFIIVRERYRYNRKSFTKYESDYAGVTQMLEQVLLTQKVSISLKIFNGVDVHNDKIANFLSKFGSLVLSISWSHNSLNALEFCKLMFQIFPNLRELHHMSSMLWEDPEQDGYFNPDLPQNKHRHLRKIKFGYDEYNLSCMETMLKMFENLEQIENFPLVMINAIVVAQKGHALKSLCDCDFYDDPDRFHQNGETIVTAFEKLAQVQPKLTSLTIDPEAFSNHEENSFEMIKPYLLTLLRSSHESLETLVIPSIRSNLVEHFPKFQGLQELEFNGFNPGAGVFLPTEISLQDKFPRVINIRIEEMSLGYIKQNFPENIISPWGSQIAQLTLGLVEPEILPFLQRLFPSIYDLRVRCEGTQIPNILQKISRLWPQLRMLSINVATHCHEEKTWVMGRNLRLDHAFTGLSELIIDQLEDPSIRKKEFTEEQIHGFKDQSIIFKLKELEVLIIFLGDCQYRIGSESTDTYMRLTPLAHEFGFSLLPQLKVIVGIDNRANHFKEIKRDIEPLASCSNIKIHESW